MTAPRRPDGFVLADRTDAGHRLAAALAEGTGPAALTPATVLLGLCRGGVPVAAVAAADLDLPVDVVATRKLGVPGHAEVAFGALASCAGRRARTTDRVLVDRLLASGVPGERLDQIVARETAALARQEDEFLQGAGRAGSGRAGAGRAGSGSAGSGSAAAASAVAGRPVVLCDDGIATGATMLAAVDAARAAGAARVMIASPVGSPLAVERLGAVADAVVCLQAPADFHAVGAYYRAFPQCTDAEVIAALDPGRGTAR